MTLLNLRHQKEFTELSSEIKRLSNDLPIDFYLSPGNWGDAMINQGTLQFFAYFDIKFKLLRREDFPERSASGSNSVAVVGGGGGWCRNWSSTIDFVGECTRSYSEVLILPTSFDIQNEHTGAHLFRRDHSMSAAHAPRSVFCHDMAFFLNNNIDTSETDSIWRLYALRTDKEKSAHSYPPINSIDLSLLGNSYHSIDALLTIVNRYKEIITDRLHIAIAGSLLGKKVGLLPGNYPKNASVADSTLLLHYPLTRLLRWSNYPKPGENFIE